MNIERIKVASGLLLLWLVSACPASEKSLPEEVVEASATMKSALQKQEFRRQASLRDWIEVARTAHQQLPEKHYAREMLETAIADAEHASDTEAAGKTLQQDLRDIQESITFRPIREASLPEGFPDVTPVNRIEVKSYPAYRLAEVEMKGGENDAFMKLFKHIKREEIAMTAPVEIGHASTEPQAGETSMAFLYRTPKLGETGTDDEDEQVSVRDIPPATYVSVGCRGKTSRGNVAEANRKLKLWLEKHDEYQANGPMRVLGYNSPFVPGFMRYFEVQIPVEEVE